MSTQPAEPSRAAAGSRVDRQITASKLYQLTSDIRFVQDALGHASPTTTAVYAQWARRGKAEVVERLVSPGRHLRSVDGAA